MRHALLLAGLTLFMPSILPSANAKNAGFPPYMTGARLLQLLWTPPDVKGGLDMSPSQYLDTQRGHLYIDGVHDSSIGKAWCPGKQHPPKPDTVHSAAIEGLLKLPPGELHRNAAALIVDIWASRWPCTRRGSQ